VAIIILEPGFYASKKEMELKIGKYMIRDWRTLDSSSIVKYANNKKIWANLRDGFPHPYQLSDAENFLSNVARQNPRTIFAIANNKEAIGSIGLRLGEDVHRFTAEMGYWLAEPFWNKGIMSKIVIRFTEFAFEKFALNRIFAEPYTENTASVRVLEKAGFVLEGTLKANAFKDGKVLDQFLYSKIGHEIRKPYAASQIVFR
jgi:RimJ/RimL family protein N-acetyltransferase